MAEFKPIRAHTTSPGYIQFGASDTIPPANIPGLVDISPSQITSDQDNYNPTGFSTADVVLLSFDTGLRAITGFASWTTGNGKGKWLINTSVNSGYIAAQHPDSTSTNRVAADCDYIFEGGGSVYIYYDTTVNRVRLFSGTFNPFLMHLSGRGQTFFIPPGSTVQADHPFLGLAQASSGSNGNTAPTSTLPAAWDLNNGGNAAGASTIYISKNNNGFSFFGSAHIVVGFTCWITAVSSGIQRYTAQVSLTNNPSGTAINNNNSFGIRYVDTANSGKWLFFSRDNAGSETTADTGITAAANTLLRGYLMIDKARSEERIFITDGTTTYQARNTGNLPNAVLCGARAIIVKSIGTGTVSLNAALTAYEIRV